MLKKFADLTEQQQEKALQKMQLQILKPISEGFMHPEFEKEIRDASEQAERKRTPWFFMEILYPRIEKRVKELARMNAEDVHWNTDPNVWIEDL